MRGNEEIIHFETHSQSSFYTIISIYPHSSIFILTPKKISFSLGIKKKGQHYVNTTWNKEDVVNVFTVAVTVSSGVLTPTKKDNYLKPLEHVWRLCF